jgi:hypothetical protein
MIGMAKRLQALKRVFRVEPAGEKASVIFEKALTRLGDADMAVIEEVATLRDQGKLSQLTAAQEECRQSGTY